MLRKKRALLFILWITISLIAWNIYRANQDDPFEKFITKFIPAKLETNISYPNDKIFDPKTPTKDTLIKLPEPYLRAGSFHPELYPHDASYSMSSILRLVSAGVLSEKYLELVKSMLNDFYFLVENYGYVLNGNRTYYITRSQANVIPTNVLEYYNATHDKEWLDEVGIKLAQKTFDYWTQDLAHVNLAPSVLYKWIAHGEGPCVEVLASHKEHNFYYDKVLAKLVEFAFQEDSENPIYARGFDYSKVLDDCVIEDIATKSACALSDYYYMNDRASRVSGYDTNHLYGPFNSFTTEFVPVDHNAKLYRNANDLATLMQITGNLPLVEHYREQASRIKSTILKLLWDDKQGMFFDYHLDQQSLRTIYAFSSAAYTIWARIFDLSIVSEKEILMRLVKFLEENLEGPSGLYASNLDTGMHWDKPYTWPIQQGMIVNGVMHYARELNASGNSEDAEYLRNFARRISQKYIDANFRDWQLSHGKSIKEKHLENNEENLMTGYAMGENYSWNLLAVLDLLEVIKELQN